VFRIGAPTIPYIKQDTTQVLGILVVSAKLPAYENNNKTTHQSD
jgi:hypothetical protein